MITKDQIKLSDGHAGVTASGSPVIYILSKGGLHMFLTKNGQQIEALAAAPHIGIARFFAEKKAGGINWAPDYIMKSELAKGLKGDWKKEGYTIHLNTQIPHEPDAYAFLGNKQVGYLNTKRNDDGTIKATGVSVDEAHRRKGIATAMYQAIEKQANTKFTPSQHQFEDGEKVWAQPDRATKFGKSEDFLEIRKSFFNGEVMAEEETYAIYDHKEKVFDIMDKEDFEHTLSKGISPYSFVRRIDIESIPKILGI